MVTVAVASFGLTCFALGLAAALFAFSIGAGLRAARRRLPPE